MRRWTWYEPCDSIQANNCILFESCSLDDQMCDNCYTGHNCRAPDDQPAVHLVLGGVDDNGANLTSVEVVAATSNLGAAIPDIPPKMAYGARAAANIGGTIFACGGTDTCGKTTNQCMYLGRNGGGKPLVWADDMPQPKRRR